MQASESGHREQAPVRQRKSIVSYVQRGGRMTVGQQRAWQRQWPVLGADVSELPPGPLDLESWFGRNAPVVLEVGTGMGETTAELAAAEPEVNLLGVEVYRPGLGQLLMRAESLGLRNLRLLRGDATDLLREHIEPGQLDGIRVFFPDPWPKKRHHKRRLVQQEFVELAASRLRRGASLHLATDWQDYAEQMLAACAAEPKLANVYGDAGRTENSEQHGWAPRPGWRPVTKFEERAQEEGRSVRDLIFERN